MKRKVKRALAVLTTMALAINTTGINVLAGEQGNKGQVQEFSAENEIEVSTDFDSIQSAGNMENQDIENDLEIVGENEVPQQESVDGQKSGKKITAFESIGDSQIVLQEKPRIEELSFPKELEVYIDNSQNSEWISVTWECEDDYSNTNYDLYTFVPVWDEEQYMLEESVDMSQIPYIEIVIDSVKNQNVRDSSVVTPEGKDYLFDVGKIEGLKSDYLETLSDDQKKNINLVIPEEIDGKKVTEIDNEAFKLFYPRTEYKNCQFVGLDLSKAVNLTRIGDGAFYKAAEITGGLSIPDSVTEIGNDAFRECKGFTGELKLPASLKRVGTYAFSDCGLTGTLTIPEGTEIIDENSFRVNHVTGFTGKLVIPASVKTLGQVAFSGNKNITSVEFRGNDIVEIPDSVFRYCGLNGSIIIPDSVQTIGKNVFGDTSLKTIYLPKMKDSNNDNFIKSNTFGSYGSSKLTAIVCDKDDHTKVCSILGDKFSEKVGYIVDVKFQGSEAVNNITRLYNLPYNYVKDDQGVWNADDTYRFPQVQGKKWGLSENAIKPVSESDKVLQDTLYQIDTEVPIITFGSNIDKVYDGRSAELKVMATHSKAHSVKGARVGDVVFYYWWYLGTIGSSNPVLNGYDENVLEITDVIEPRYGIYCTVKVNAYVVGEGGKINLLHNEQHDFTVYVRQAESTVTPVYNRGMIHVSNGFPEISISEGDTQGTIVWDAEQTFEIGKKDYAWTFTPEENASGSYNYTTKHGTAELYGVDGQIYTITPESTEHGKINQGEVLEALQGEDAVIYFEPDAGYKLKMATVDGRDVTGDILNNTYTMHNVQENHTVSAVFVPLTADSMTEIIEQLPVIPDGTAPEKDQVDSILDAKLHYESLDESVQNDISKEKKEELCDVIAKLLQVEIEVQGTITLDNPNLLLENMTSDEVTKLKENKQSKYKLEVIVEDTNLEDQEEAAITQHLNGAKIGKPLNVSVIKTVTENGTPKTEKLSVLKTPVKLQFEIPSELKEIPSGYLRTFYMIRLHEEKGVLSVDTLQNLSADTSKIIVESDRYSIYTIAYKDIKTGGGNYNPTLSLGQVAEIPLVLADEIYTGTAIEPEVSLILKNTGKTLTKDKDYTLTYNNNIDVGAASITIQGIGGYTGVYTVKYNIVARDIKDAIVTAENAEYFYNGKKYTPKVNVKLGETILEANNYKVSYTDNVNAGEAKIVVEGWGNFTGTATGTFVIKKASQKLTISKARADALQIRNTNANYYTMGIKGAKTRLVYKSSNKKIAVVNEKGKVFFKHTCGQATITVTAVGSDNYNAFSMKVAVAVKPATPRLTAAGGRNFVNVKASRIRDITGYQIIYSTDKQFSHAKSKQLSVKGTAALNKKIKNLSSNTRYYVKVRAYKKMSNKYIWGNWSKEKNVRTK